MPKYTTNGAQIVPMLPTTLITIVLIVQLTPNIDVGSIELMKSASSCVRQGALTSYAASKRRRPLATTRK